MALPRTYRRQGWRQPQKRPFWDRGSPHDQAGSSWE
jgi:hypothetical protein